MSDITRNDLKELDYGITMAVQTLVEAMGMQAENQRRLSNGFGLAYTEEQFKDLINNNGVHHNGCLARWLG